LWTPRNVALVILTPPSPGQKIFPARLSPEDIQSETARPWWRADRLRVEVISASRPCQAAAGDHVDGRPRRGRGRALDDGERSSLVDGEVSMSSHRVVEPLDVRAGGGGSAEDRPQRCTEPAARDTVEEEVNRVVDVEYLPVTARTHSNVQCRQSLFTTYNTIQYTVFFYYSHRQTAAKVVSQKTVPVLFIE